MKRYLLICLLPILILLGCDNNLFGPSKKELLDRAYAYADEHYSEIKYSVWLNNLEPQELASLSHTLPRDTSGIIIKNNEYYKLIGKYNQFIVGWDDVSSDISLFEAYIIESKSRAEYIKLINKAN